MIELNPRQLQCRTREIAERYGKPHVGAFYANSSADSNRLENGAWCCVCGRPATNSHHWPPRSQGRLFAIPKPDGTGDHLLRPALFAVCGTGTMGCHGRWHNREVDVLWRWDDEAAEEAWWDGTMLMEVVPHSKELYLYGHWEFYDFEHGRTWEVLR